MRRIALLLFLSICIAQLMNSQSKSVEFVFDGKKYETLRLTGHQIDGKLFRVDAKIDTIKNSYKFTIPDSLISLMYCYAINGQYDDIKKVLYSPELVTVKNDDTALKRMLSDNSQYPERFPYASVKRNSLHRNDPGRRSS